MLARSDSGVTVCARPRVAGADTAWSLVRRVLPEGTVRCDETGAGEGAGMRRADRRISYRP